MFPLAPLARRQPYDEYDEARYLLALQERHSPLVALVVQSP
jgi:hypothetical protein